MKIEKYNGRNWAVYDNSGCLICVTVYKKGAKEVVRRLSTTITDNLHEAQVNHDKLIRLSRELKVVNRKFNQLVKEIKAIEDKAFEAVL